MPASSVRFFFLLTLTVALIPTTSANAGEGPISGRVVDPAGRPVRDARVLVSGAGLPLHSVVTDGEGRFTVPTPPVDRVTLRVAAEGFSSEAREIDTSAGPHDAGVVVLSISAVSEAIVVSASQVEVPLTQVTSSVTVIGGAELESRQIHTIADALRVVPGMSVTSTGGLGATTGVFPRGGESNYTLVVIDGVPVNDFGGDFDFGQTATANVERIEIVRGPQSALFGSNAIGAVVRMVTRRGGPPSAQVSFEGGHFDTSRISASTAGERGSFEWGASFDRLRSDGMNGELTGAGETVANDDYDRRGGALSAGWRRGAAWIRGDMRHSTDERGFPGPFGSDPTGSFTGIDLESRGHNERTQAALSTSLPVSPRLRAQGHVTVNRVDSDFASPFGSSDAFSRRWTTRLQADAALTRGAELSAGVELQRERAGSTFITDATFQEIPVQRQTLGSFVEGRVNLRDRLFAAAGVRLEHIRRERLEPSGSRPELAEDDVVSANPKLSAGWIAAGGASSFTKIRGAVGTGIRPPDGFELAFTDNPALRPERSISVEGGLDQAFAAGRGLVDATAFLNRYDDLIVAVGSFNGSSRYRTDNIANARARGLELGLTLRHRIAARLPIDIAGRAGYTFLDSEVLAVDNDSEAPPPFEIGQPLLRRPRHQFSADIAVAAGRLSGFLRASGRGRTLDVEPSLGTFGGLFETAGYQVWNTGGAFRVTRFAEVFVRVENVFDRGYEEAFGFPALGRRASAGLRLVAGR